MIKNLFFLLILSSSFGMKAQELVNLISSKEVVAITYWEVGDQFKYKKTEEKCRYENGKRKSKYDELSANDITLVVKEQNDSSYLMEMTYSNFQFESKGLELAGEVIDVLNIHYVTNELGMFDSIVNAKELVAVAQVQLKKTVAELSLDKEEKEQIIALLTVILSEENIEAIFAADISMIHNYYGFSFEMNKPVAFDLIYPTIGDFEVNGELVVTLKSIDKANDKCILSGVQKPNAYELDGYMNVLAKEFNVDDELSEFSFSSKVKDTYDMQLSTGTMNKVTYKQTTKVSIDSKTFKIGKTITLKLQN